MTVNDLPHVNASLNGVSTILILFGYAMIRRKNIAAHRACMISAAVVSALFLVCYLVYHYYAGHVRFTGTGAARVFYLAVLISHVVLAAAVPFLVGVALYLGLRRRDAMHRRVVRWAFPIWLYVSITGVVVYVMLYHLYAPDERATQTKAHGMPAVGFGVNVTHLENVVIDHPNRASDSAMTR